MAGAATQNNRSAFWESVRFAYVTTFRAGKTVWPSNTLQISGAGSFIGKNPLKIGQRCRKSALQFQRQLGLSRYETAFQILHKLRAGLVRPQRDAIGEQHPVEVDETFVGGRTKGEGRGVHHKAIVVGAVEVRSRTPAKGKKHQRAIYAGRLRLRLVPGREAKELTEFVQANVVKGATVRTDGWRGYNDLATLGYVHEPLVLDGDPEKTDAHLPMIHIAFSNLKTWLLGTHHGVSQQHLQAYLNEFVFRFNRRFYPMTSFNSALGLAAHTSAPTYKKLYEGRKNQPLA